LPHGLPRPNHQQRVAQRLRSIDRRLAVIEKHATNVRSVGQRVTRTAMWGVGLWVTLSLLGRVFG